MTDNRANEPTDAMILAALNAYSSKGLEIDGYDPTDEYPSLDMWGERFASQMRAALVAAQGAAPQAESEDNVMCRCGHGTGSHDFSDPQEPCREIVCDCRGWFGVSPVPSSGVDEEKLAEVIAQARNRWAIYGRKDELFEPYLASAVAEWLKGQGGESRGR